MLAYQAAGTQRQLSVVVLSQRSGPGLSRGFTRRKAGGSQGAWTLRRERAPSRSSSLSLRTCFAAGFSSAWAIAFAALVAWTSAESIAEPIAARAHYGREMEFALQMAKAAQLPRDLGREISFAVQMAKSRQPSLSVAFLSLF